MEIINIGPLTQIDNAVCKHFFLALDVSNHIIVFLTFEHVLKKKRFVLTYSLQV